MKKLTFISILTGILMVSVSCEKVTEIEGPELEHGQIVTVTITSVDPNIGAKQAKVYLPPDYDANRSPGYPVIYMLHGYGGDYTFWQGVEDIKDIADYLISTGQMESMIIVMPDGNNALGGSFYTNSEYLPSYPSVFGRYEDYIVNEVVSYIDANYNTIPDRDHRGILGISMGGYGACKLAFKHPDVFGAAAIHSGPVAFEQFLATIPFVNLNLLDLVKQEWADFGGRIPSNVRDYLGEDRPLSTMLFAMAGAFTPKIDSLGGFDTLKHEFALDTVPGTGGTLWAGVRLPFDTSYNIIDSLWNQWLEQHDPLTILKNNIDSIRTAGLAIYIDVGADDELFLQPHAYAMHSYLEQANYTHEYETFTEYPGYPEEKFPAGHGTHLYLRVKKSLEFMSRVIGD